MFSQVRAEPLTDLHRVFWAIVTRRYRLALLLWERAADPVAAAICAAWILRNLSTDLSHEKRETMADEYDARATRVTARLAAAVSADLRDAFLHEYLYYGVYVDRASRRHCTQMHGGHIMGRLLHATCGLAEQAEWAEATSVVR